VSLFTRGVELEFDQIIELYSNAFAKYGDSPASVLWPKGRQEIRFRALTSHFDWKNVKSILDFGCGLGHLYPYALSQGFEGEYIGVDVVPDFIEFCRIRHVGAKFILSNGQLPSISPVDHVIGSGCFNLVNQGNSNHFEDVQELISGLFEMCTGSVAFDFMSTYVDFEQSMAFHVDPFEMARFIHQNVSPRLKLDTSYLPFEFAIVAHKSLIN
jgi:SAM-dependent methyltransferase